MTYNVFGGMLNLAQPTYLCSELFISMSSK